VATTATTIWNYLIAGDLSRRLGRVYDHFIFEAEVGAGYRFPVHATEGWTALYLRYDGFPWNHILFTTAAINTGLSYVNKVSDVEMDAGSDRGNPNGSRLLHYLGPEITFAAPQYRNSELVMRWHHRSGVFGTFNGVWGGSNVVTVGFRQRFWAAGSGEAIEARWLLSAPNPPDRRTATRSMTCQAIADLHSIRRPAAVRASLGRMSPLDGGKEG
jgi:hypothetical protein